MNVALKEFHAYMIMFLKCKTSKSLNSKVGDYLKQLTEEQDENTNTNHHEKLNSTFLRNKKNELKDYIKNQ